MVAILDSMMFAAAFAAAIWVYAFTLAPAVPRIMAILRGDGVAAASQDPFYVLSDRRLRTRVHATQRRSQSGSFREAA